jgi:hypothetical protein
MLIELQSMERLKSRVSWLSRRPKRLWGYALSNSRKVKLEKAARGRDWLGVELLVSVPARDVLRKMMAAMPE